MGGFKEVKEVKKNKAKGSQKQAKSKAKSK
jgi:hypothetical protein